MLQNQYVRSEAPFGNFCNGILGSGEGQKSCQVTCTDPCQITCEDPSQIICPDPCQVICPDPCQVICQDPCPVICLDPCQVICPDPCDRIYLEDCQEKTTEDCCEPSPVQPDPKPSTVQPVKTPEIIQPITCYKVICRNKSLKIRGCPPTKIDRIEEIKLETLGKPVGVSFGTHGLNYPDVKPLDENRAIQAYSTCLMAFGEIYITPEAEWDSLVLNRILYEGKQHFDKALLTMTEKAVKESVANPGPVTEKDISKTMEICENSMELHIYDPFIIGTLTSEDYRIPNFYYGIRKFIRKLTYCLLTVANHYILIWKSSGLYFVFDCYGRDNALRRDTKTGVAVLIGLTCLKAVSHLIVNLSELPYDEVYVLRKIKMMALFPCCIFDNDIERRIRQREFEVINDYHAILKGHIHIGQSCFKENRYKFSLAIAVTALIYSKIDAPSTWDGYEIDKIIVLANAYYNAWTKCNHHIELVVHDIPAEISIGRYNVTISVVPVEACGTWRCLPNFKRSKLTIAIKEIFARSSSLIVQIAARSYALWKRGDFFYIFDPYKHQCRGSKLQAQTANIHLCSSLNMLCCILTNQIVDLPSPSPFCIHSLKLIALNKKGKIKPIDEKAPTCHCVFKDSSSDDVEVLSLNTSIGDVKCPQELNCVAAKYGFDPDMNNLDSPSLSQTQVVPDYDDLKKGSGGEDSEDEEEEEEDEESESEESEIEISSDDEEGDGKGKGKKRKKGKKNKKGKKKDKGKKDKAKKDKNKKDKNKKEKDKKEKDKKEKDKKDKDKKDKNKKKKNKGKDKDKKGKGGDGKGDGSSGCTGDSEDSGDGDKDGDKSKDKGKGTGESDGGSLMEEEGEQIICDSEDSDCRRGQALGCIPNSYPGYSCDPHNIAVVGSESGGYESLFNLIKTGFKCADRILTMTPWGNYVVFKSKGSYLLYDGCTCNIDRFRHLDLSVGTAGLLCFTDLNDIIEHIMKGKGNKTDREIMCEKRHLERTIDEICEKYGCISNKIRNKTDREIMCEKRHLERTIDEICEKYGCISKNDCNQNC